MKAIIPAAGEGTRLRPHTHTVPKVLVGVAGKPILGHILDALVRVGVDEVILVLGRFGDQVTRYVEEKYPLRVRFVPQEERRGLGHAIHLARDYVDENPFLIVYGDTIFDADLSRVVEASTTRIGVKEVEDPRRFGVVTVEGDRITRFVEKPDTPISNLAIVGINYMVDSARLFDCLERLIRSGTTTKGEYQLTDALQLMLEDGEEMHTFPVEGWFDCGKPETLLATNHHLLTKTSHYGPRSGSIFVPPVFVADSAEITDSIVGPDVSIDEEACIQSSIVRNSIVSRKATVRNVVLSGSIIGVSAVVDGPITRLNVGDSSEVRFNLNS
jgi:glucose-1-phosphate thymidylyltransferase